MMDSCRNIWQYLHPEYIQAAWIQDALRNDWRYWRKTQLHDNIHTCSGTIIVDNIHTGCKMMHARRQLFRLNADASTNSWRYSCWTPPGTMDNIHEGRHASRSARCMNNFDDIHACRTHPGWLVGSSPRKKRKEKSHRLRWSKWKEQHVQQQWLSRIVNYTMRLGMLRWIFLASYPGSFSRARKEERGRG